MFVIIMSIYNDTIVHAFCESRLTGGPPEYLNSITSLYMTFLSFSVLWRKELYLKSMTKIVYLLMAINGIASMLYHAKLTYSYKLADEYTMILPISLGVANFADKLLQSYKSIIFNFFYLSYNVYIMILDTDLANDTKFPWFFTVDLFILFYLYFLAYKKGRDPKKIGLEGIMLCAGSSIVWTVTEYLCEVMPIIGIVGHSIWHIGMPLGFHRIIIFMDKNF
jgi:hypothetical protein